MLLLLLVMMMMMPDAAADVTDGVVNLRLKLLSDSYAFLLRV